MRPSNGLTTFLFVAILALAVAAALGWLRPVRIVTQERDWAVRVAERATNSAGAALWAAEQWQARYVSLVGVCDTAMIVEADSIWRSQSGADSIRIDSVISTLQWN